MSRILHIMMFKSSDPNPTGGCNPLLMCVRSAYHISSRLNSCPGYRAVSCLGHVFTFSRQTNLHMINSSSGIKPSQPQIGFGKFCLYIIENTDHQELYVLKARSKRFDIFRQIYSILARSFQLNNHPTFETKFIYRLCHANHIEYCIVFPVALVATSVLLTSREIHSCIPDGWLLKVSTIICTCRAVGLCISSRMCIR